MTNSNEAIAAAREIYPGEPIPFYTREDELERIASIIQKHYAAKDAEIGVLRSKDNYWRESNEKVIKERDQLKARVAELEKAATEAKNHLRAWFEMAQPHPGKIDVAELCLLEVLTSPPSDSLTRLQELERNELKARVAELEKALRAIADYDNHARSDLPPEKAVMSAIEISKRALSAMEKQK